MVDIIAAREIGGAVSLTKLKDFKVRETPFFLKKKPPIDGQTED
jgi:hypothetical protein